ASFVSTDSGDPVQRGGPLHRSAAKRFFSLDRARPVSLLARQKRGPRRAPRGGERRRSGGSETWPCGPGRTIRSLRRRHGGAEGIAGHWQIPASNGTHSPGAMDGALRTGRQFAAPTCFEGELSAELPANSSPTGTSIGRHRSRLAAV